jgi:hypothetical protein
VRRVGKFFRLSQREKVLFVRALFLLIHSRLSLQFGEFRNVVRHFSRKTSFQKPDRLSRVSSTRVASLLDAASRLIPPPTCLSKALAGSVLFKACGYQTQLHIGVTREGGSLFEAHAWLTLDGHVVVGGRADLERYRELPFVFEHENNNSFSHEVGKQTDKGKP